jgi:tetratricopeptide (TPR) repeat protein
MTGLATHHAFCPVGVDVFAVAEALALLAKVLGREVVERDPHASAELARQCGRMPLALRIAAAKLAAQPRRTIRDLTQDLAGADRLDLLSVDGDSRSVRAVFVSAYGVLTATGARLFRLLGLHPGQTFGPHAAAAVADLTIGAARQAVDELVTAHLAIRAGAERYRFHDLVQLFARQCATVDEPPPMRADAARRLVDWYLTVVDAANRAVHPGRDRVTPAPRYRPAETPFRPDHHAALAFLDGERGNLLPLVRYAAEEGHEEAAWQLTYLLAGFYESRGDRDERVELCRLGLAAARRAGDTSAEGLMLSGLGVAMIAAHRHDEALDRLREALPLMRASGDQRGEGHVHNNIAVVHSGLGRFDLAIEAFSAALAIHTANGYRLGVALALNNIGHTYVRMGQPELGFADLVKSVAMFREIDNPRLEASALHSLGEASLGLGDTLAALDHLSAALEICRRIGNRRDEAAMLNSLGAVHLRRSEHAAALARFDQARLLVRELADAHLEAITLNHAGEAYLRMGDLAAAQRRLGRALALRARIPDPLEAAHLQRNLAELERRTRHPIAATTTTARRASGLAPASPRPEAAPRP